VFSVQNHESNKRKKQNEIHVPINAGSHHGQSFHSARYWSNWTGRRNRIAVGETQERLTNTVKMAQPESFIRL
jgi:hypothetical protein